MNGFFSIINVDLVFAMIRLSTPIVLAAIGAVMCERSGIVNIAMEGIMIIGAFFAAVVSIFTGNPWLGLIAGIVSGALFSLIHAVATISFHLDHVVSGAVLNILAFGIVRYLMILFFGHPGTTDPIPLSLAAYRLHIPILSDIPIIGRVLFSQTPIVYISIFLVFFLAFITKKTRLGLHIRAAGEHPLALETIGVSVKKIRYIAVVISGITSGLAGAYLSIENNVSFTEGMTNGRGFIALAANISGGWNTVGAWLASLFFGLADALQVRFQVMKLFRVPAEVFVIFPYVATVLAVAGLVRRSRPPKSLGVDFMIEKEGD
ncbi:MAG: ABC transporter permease [Spirochaetales bacterium]|nr:MAG: ABC transporter permease [Spirochaetales bacterium]